MHLVEVADAGPQLAALVREAQAGEEVVLTQNNMPVVKLTPLGKDKTPKRQLGTASGLIWMADDFNETPEDFAEYL